MKISVVRLSLLVSCLPASLSVQQGALTSCDDGGNLLLQTHASHASHASLPTPWDRRNYLVGTSHKAGSHLLRNVMRRTFDILGANFSCHYIVKSAGAVITSMGGEHVCQDTKAPVRFQNTNNARTILQMRLEGPMRGVMIIRDPFEMVASAYVYHHRGAEVGSPLAPSNVMSLGPNDGVPATAQSMWHVVENMTQAYQVAGDDVLPVRYEDFTRSSVDFNATMAWLAAHWERKLKKQDYVETDLRSLLSSISRRRSVVSLRATGHLLVGACKIYVKKCSIFEEEAEEVRTALMMAFSRPTDMQAAEELAPIREVRTHTAPPDQALLGGKRHMARIEDITLKDSKEATVPLQETDDLFGSLSQGELQEVTRLVRKRVLPKGALEALESKTSIADLDFDTMPLVALSDKPQVEEADDDLQLEGEGDVMPMDLEAALEDEATPAAAHFSPVPMAPQDVDPDDLNHVAGQAAMQLVPFPNPVVARQLLTLGEEERQAVLNFFPTVRREEVQMLIDQAPDPLSTRRGGGGGVGGRGGAQVPLSYDAAAVVAAPFVRPANFGTLVMSDGGARKKRRTYFLADEVTEIPKETYKGYLNDRTAITNRENLEYNLLLPHNSPLLPNFTTTFSDVCKTLVETIILGSEVAEKRRRLYRDGEFQGAPGAEKSTDAADAEDAEGLTAEQRRLLRLSVGSRAEPKEATPLAPVLGPMISPERAGLRSPGMLEETPVVTETLLLENAPSSMNAVVTGAMDDEDQSGNARLGYSGRSEKMHRFLAKEFKDTGAADLSYEEMCRNQTRGRRELIAGCFFELLVLKTNGVINLEQANPLSDIKIAKAGQFAK